MPPKLALIEVLRNEEDLIAANLAYHHRLGVSRAFLFLDRCNDRTAEIAAQYSWAKIIHRDRDPADHFMSRHQVKCMDAGLALAREEGFDWLLHLDADEFASADNESNFAAWRGCVFGTKKDRVDAAHLTRMLEKVPDHIEMVVLRPREAIPTPLAHADPPWSLPYFLTRGYWPRVLMNPITGNLQKLTRPIGHVLGKSIVRTSARVQALSAHRWTRRQEITHLERLPVKTRYGGFHYHFAVTGFQQWYDKHRKFSEYPAVWEKGTAVDFPKQAWKEAASQMSLADAQAYFQRYVLTDPRRLRLGMLTGKVIHDCFVDEMLTPEFSKLHQATA